MRIAIISDTHMPKGARDLPQACLARLAEAELILHAGDFIDSEVLHDIQAIGPPVHAVCGNVDRPEVRLALPETCVVEAAGGRIGMIHAPGPAAGRLERLRAQFSDVDAVVFGHTHMPEIQRAADGFTIFNPGSPTERRRAPRHTMGLAQAGPDGLVFEHVALD